MASLSSSWLGIVCLALVAAGPLVVFAQTPRVPPNSTTTENTYQTDDAKNKNLLPEIVASVAEYEAAHRTRSSLIRGPVSICYEDLGCFWRNGNYSTLGKLPSTPDYVMTQFRLFTDARQVEPDILDYHAPASITSSKFRRGQPVIFVVHGFGDSSKAQWYKDFQAAVLGKFPLANFIAVDWAGGARGPSYWQAAANTHMVGAQIAKLLSVLHNVTGTKMSEVHLIGFSLGAHVVGSTARKLEEFGLNKVGRITGLDPAGPIFHRADAAVRLSKEDADFVQIIHSNAGSLVGGYMGIDLPVGHRDFYPNGGDFQPGCKGGMHTLVASFIHDNANCNHNRAPAYVSESINSTCHFIGFPCSSYDKFLKGECTAKPSVKLDIFEKNPAPVDEPLYLQTNAEQNFCAYALKVSVTVSTNTSSRKGSLKVSLKPKQQGSSSVATATFSILKDTQFAPGKTYEEVILSRFSLVELERATVVYDRSCLKLLCGQNTGLELSSFYIQELNGSHGSQCKNITLPDGEAVKVSATNGHSSCVNVVPPV